MSNKHFSILVYRLEELEYGEPEFMKTVKDLSWCLKFDPEFRSGEETPEIGLLFRMVWALWRKSPSRIKLKIIYVGMRSAFKGLLRKMI